MAEGQLLFNQEEISESYAHEDFSTFTLADTVIDTCNPSRTNLAKELRIADRDIVHMHSLECIMSEEQLLDRIRRLTKSQVKVLKYVQGHFNHKNDGKGDERALLVFLTGGAGVGKSYITNVLIGYLQLYTSSVHGVSPVVVCAPTGVAARTVYGQTIHSLLKIPVSDYLNYEELSAYQLTKLQRQFLNVHTIIIDEISMVSDAMLTFISRRLSDVKNDPHVFGNMNVILVGDFFPIKTC